MKARGEIKTVGLFEPGDAISGESLAGHHGALLVAAPDETRALGSLLYQVVEAVPVEEIDALRKVADAARACVAWQAKHDTYKCMHEVANYDCRACAGEPPHFPVGVHEFAAMQAAVHALPEEQKR